MTKTLFLLVCIVVVFARASCGALSDDDSQQRVERRINDMNYYVSSVDSGERLAYVTNPQIIYKPVYFKRISSKGTTAIRVEKIQWSFFWWLNLIRIGSKAQCLHVGKDSQLFMGDCEREEFEAVLLMYDPNKQKIFSVVNPKQCLVMGANGEAKISDNCDKKYLVHDAV